MLSIRCFLVCEEKLLIPKMNLKWLLCVIDQLHQDLNKNNICIDLFDVCTSLIKIPLQTQQLMLVKVLPLIELLHPHLCCSFRKRNNTVDFDTFSQKGCNYFTFRWTYLRLKISTSMYFLLTIPEIFLVRPECETIIHCQYLI